MTAKSVLWALYALAMLALVGWYVWGERASLPAMRAAADLPAGHRLATGDIRLPGGAHYLRHPVKAGEPLDPDDLSRFAADLPAIETPANTVALILSIDKGTARAVPAAGSRMWICQPGGKTGAPVRVTSVLCGNADGACLGVVAVPGDRAAALARLGKPRLSSSACK